MIDQGLIQRIAKAVLYEGYMLYPYRPSAVKNQLRFNFGVLYPRAYSKRQTGNDNWEMQTECLVTGDPQTSIEVRIRFLQLMARQVLKPVSPDAELTSVGFGRVARLEVDGQLYQSWEEAVEREVTVPISRLEELLDQPREHPAEFANGKSVERICRASGDVAGAIERTTETINAMVLITAQRVTDGVFKITVRVRNTTSINADREQARERALMQSLISTHTLLGVQGGAFVSLLDPPESLREMAANCKNIGTYPVLIGENGERDTMLSAPIILYDYPQIAPESAGDLFDGTEIDEILSLRIMTMTDEEKREMRYADQRARQILERTEALPMEQLVKLHGALREPHSHMEKKTG